MKVGMRIKKPLLSEKNIIKLMLFVILIYSFNRSLILCFVPSEFYLYLIVEACVLILFFISVTKTRIKYISFDSFFWIALILQVVINHQRIVETGAITFETYVIITGFAIFYAIGKLNFWYGSFVEIAMKFCWIHIAATIFFKIFTSLYKLMVLPLFPETTQQQLLITLNEGGASGITSHYSTTGIYISIGIIILGCRYLFKNDKNGFSLLIAAIAMLVNGKRGHLIFTIFAMIVVYYLCTKERSTSKIFKIFATGIFALVVLVIVGSFVPSLLITFQRFRTLADSGDITNGRTLFYTYALNWFKENPIFGIGWGGFKIRLNQAIGSYGGLYKYMNAHNVYYQVLCELGLIGFITFIWASYGTLLGTLKSIKKKKKLSLNEDTKDDIYYLSISLAIQIFFLLYCFTGNPLYDLEIFFVYMFACAISHSYWFAQKNEKISNKSI